jgi:membrane glycosyltransferase
LAGEILSHDFVEAALMGRAGYEVWLAPQLEGSWEQSPCNLLDELQRDRRWCQGNLQNARLLAEPGWRAAHRAMFGVAALSYAVAPLWLIFIGLGLAGGGPPLGDGPLWLLTLALLLLPRVLGVAQIVWRGEAAAFGGVLRLTGGALLELLLSSLQAPLRMLAHCLYVLGALTGLRLEWKSPPRGAHALDWADSRRIGTLTLLPLIVGFGLLRRVASISLAPMLLPLTLAVPLTVLTGHPRAGRAVTRLGLLQTPEDSRPPRALLRAGDRRSFIDLMPVAAPARRLPSRQLRLLPASLLAAVVLFAVAVPRTGIAPELPPQWRVDHELTAYWRGVPSLRQVSAEAPPVRKRVRDKPARMIDDALRRRALEAVGRALADEAPPV